MTADISTATLAGLVKQVQAGNEVLLTQGDKPVAKIIAAAANTTPSKTGLQVRSIKGHRVLTPVFSQSELADEIFGTK